MNLPAQIDNELNQFVSGTDAAEAGRRLSLPVESGHFECQLTAVEDLACAFEWIALQTGRLAEASVAELQHTANALSSRLSYLLEPISPVEVDRESCVVQLRSRPPTQDDQGTGYYELVVRRGEIRLCRYGKSRGDVRRRIPATVTREVLQRLAMDFVEAVA